MTAERPGGLSAQDLADWLDAQAAALGEERIAASLGRRIARPGQDPVVWISLNSEWATGRLIRNSDGSAESRAHRFVDGAVLVDEHQPSVGVAQLEELVRACARPRATSVAAGDGRQHR
ncbi:MAG: hypothetical protein AB7W59_05120 [Acidimicrobiia bacterium]